MLPWPSRPAGAHTVYAVRWRGHRQLCTCRPLGGATCSVGPTTDRGIISSSYRASVVATCNAGGKWNINSHPGALLKECPRSLAPSLRVELGISGRVQRDGEGLATNKPFQAQEGEFWLLLPTCHPEQEIQFWWRGCLHQLEIPLFRYSHSKHPVPLVGRPPPVDTGWVSVGGA